MAKFYVGQPVICVDDRLRASVLRLYPQILNWPTQGQRYIIRSNITVMTQISRRVWKNLTFVTVRDMINPVITWGDGQRAEAGFHEDRFEPATDIGEFNVVKDMVGLYHGKADHEDEPDSHPTDEPVRKKEKAMGYEDEDDMIDGVGFADPGGNSALRAATKSNPRNLPCPSCERPNRLTPLDRARGYQCDSCADRSERGMDP